MIAVKSYEEFAAALRSKLFTEIAEEGPRERAVDVGLYEVRRGCQIVLCVATQSFLPRQHVASILQYRQTYADEPISQHRPRRLQRNGGVATMGPRENREQGAPVIGGMP